jgi:hypothetical protein
MSIFEAFSGLALRHEPRVGETVRFRMQLIVREGVCVVAIPSKLEGFLDRGCAIFALLTIGIVQRAAGWHGDHSLGAEGHDGSEAKSSGVHACFAAWKCTNYAGKMPHSALRLERKLQWADEESARNQEIDLTPEERSITSREHKCVHIYMCIRDTY